MTTIAQPRKVLDRPDAGSLERAEGAIEFDAIRFHYGKDEGVIDDLSLSIAPGEKIGLVGRSGAGKKKEQRKTENEGQRRARKKRRKKRRKGKKEQRRNEKSEKREGKSKRERRKIKIKKKEKER
eukprot:TRINITY_DN33752_c0_g1_i1.p3 TRINITY_DN33752_c0_g1~~TRINITY_DN33752_c0_g1_i1.p3  ORF type:complete len:144 (+),score=25.92 TRINITY_DN33752_c0_g1_i1:58-432(+)